MKVSENVVKYKPFSLIFPVAFFITAKCDVPLGIQDGRITQSMFTASSMTNRYYGPWSSRLQARNSGAFRGGWVAKVSNNRQWLQVDLGAKCVVKRIATQARYDGNHWVTKYTVSYSSNGVRFYPYQENKKTRVGSDSNDCLSCLMIACPQRI